MKLGRKVFMRSITEYQATVKILLLLTLASLLAVQQSLTFGGPGNLFPFARYIGFYFGAVKTPSVLCCLSDGSSLVTLTSWRIASIIMSCLAVSASSISTNGGMAALDLISPRRPSAYRLQWLHFLRYLLVGIFHAHRMRLYKTPLEFANHFEATRMRQFMLEVDRGSHARTIADRSSCSSPTRRAAMKNFGYGGINTFVIQEKQIREASSSIGTGFRKRLSVRCSIPPKRDMDASVMSSQFEDLLRRRRLNDVADQCRRRKGSPEPLHLGSLSARSFPRSISRELTEQSNSLPAYWALRYHPKIPTPPPDFASRPRSLRAWSRLDPHTEPLLWISGRAGAGKASLVQSLMHSLRDEFYERLDLLKLESISTAFPQCSSPHREMKFTFTQGYNDGWYHTGREVDLHFYEPQTRTTPPSDLWPSRVGRNVDYNAAAHLRRSHSDRRLELFQRRNQSADDRRGQEGACSYCHVKQRCHEQEDVVQPSPGISSRIMDEPAPIAVVGMSIRLPDADFNPNPKNFWDLLSQNSTVDSRIHRSRLDTLERNSCFIVTPMAPGLSDHLQAVCDVLQKIAWHSIRDTMDTSSRHADLPHPQAIRLAYDATPTPPPNLGALTGFDGCRYDRRESTGPHR